MIMAFAAFCQASVWLVQYGKWERHEADVIGYCCVHNGGDIVGAIMWGCYSRREVRVLSWVYIAPRVIVGDLFDIA